jgi:1-phosphatidylinositol-4-phosphate 5-kinase
VIDGQHEQYILTMGMMMGIRVSLARAQSNRDALRVRDFAQLDKLVFPAGGCKRPGFKTPPHQLNHTFKFKDYAPKVFGAIREMYGVKPDEYMNSVCGDFNFIQFIANSRCVMGVSPFANEPRGVVKKKE